MSSHPQIRPLKQSDLKIVRYQLGLSLMGPLAVANDKAYVHPFTIAAWVALSSVMIQLMNWWPTTDGPLGIWGVLSPLPALAAIAVPLMFFFDWNHRPTFEEAVHKALTAPDMQDPLTHYTRSPASGFFILEHKEKSIGLIALDASMAPFSRTPSSKTKASTTAETAIIRHFFVEEQYRPSGVQLDLLEYAVSRTFNANTSPLPRRVRVISSDLDAYKVAAIRASKFHPVVKWDDDGPQEWNTGVYRWKNRWVEVTREEWAATKKE